MLHLEALQLGGGVSLRQVGLVRCWLVASVANLLLHAVILISYLDYCLYIIDHYLIAICLCEL